MSIVNYLESALKSVGAVDIPSQLVEAQQYAIASSGKRVRPMMALLAAQLFAPELTKEHFCTAVALEVFHTFTLVHDDIMDKAALRRGKPTVVNQYGTNTAILAGDALLIRAYDYLGKGNNAAQTLPLFNQMAMAVCEGQQMDVDYEQLASISTRQYFDMAGKKTAALLAAAAAIGGLSAFADDNDTALLYDFGYQLGLAFQVQDDYLDTYGDTAAFGKQTGGDIVQKKKTYLFAAACEQLPPERKAAFLQAFASTQLTDNQQISTITAFYNQAQVNTIANAAISHYFEKSKQSLSKIPAPAARKDDLWQFAEWIMGRKK
ncbi:isoprenyl synthetase [Bacteroidia bacterium]|nr:isoprenyl synthetase [Bacteroidia bacterium]